MTLPSAGYSACQKCLHAVCIYCEPEIQRQPSRVVNLQSAEAEFSLAKAASFFVVYLINSSFDFLTLQGILHSTRRSCGL